MKRTKIKSFV